MAFPQTGSCAGGGRSTHHSPLMAAAGSGFVEGDHRLEKLEFALAVAVTRGDQHRIAVLRQQIEALGGNVEEPGT